MASVVALLATVAAPLSGAAQTSTTEILNTLNESPAIQGSERIKSYELLFGALLELSDPPFEIGSNFNQATIHPGMDGWALVSDWAASNPDMAEAILAAEERQIIGLPYGTNNVPSSFVEADLYAGIAPDGDLRDMAFPYLHGIELMAAYATAETYRRMEAGEVEDGLNLAVAHLFVLRQFCDRDFLDEKMRSIRLLTEALSILRDVFYVYLEAVPADLYREIGGTELPFLRPDRNALFMPEGDRIVAEALIREVFDSRGQPDREKFSEVFATLQAQDEPLSRFGAVRRWEMIADVHDSLDASLERLQLIYDDWWRRWRVQEYDPILDVPTQFERTNPIRYAAVISSVRDIDELFDVRRALQVAVNGTAMSAGLCAYRKTFETFPEDPKRVYAQFVRKSSDADPYDRNFGSFEYLYTSTRHPIDTAVGRIWVDPGMTILFSKGQNNTSERAEQHTNDGLEGDIVVWPPVRALAREQGLIE